MTGKRLTEIKKELGLTRAQMARLLGCSYQALVNWEGLAEIKPHLAQELEDLLRLPKDKRELVLQKNIGAQLGGRRQNVRAVGALARALMEQHNFGFEEAFAIAHYQYNLYPPTYSEQSKAVALQRAGTHAPEITKRELRRMLKIYEERKCSK